MAPKPGDTNPPTGYDEGEPPGSTGVRGRRTNPSKANRPTPAIIDIQIARIEKVTMTAAEYDNAVEALAVLIARWWQQHPDKTA
jgi:hypothetical protein